MITFYRKKFKNVKERGQALVESALILPLMVFFVLGMIQLVLLQHAKIMTDYAAYAAARAGVVHSCDPIAMNSAANIAILPTVARTHDFQSFISSYFALVFKEIINNTLSDIAADQGISDSLGVFDNLADALIAKIQAELGLAPTYAHTFVVRPTLAQFDSDGEIDFDVLATGSSSDSDIQKRILTVAVNYNFSLVIPFANWIIFQSWMAAEVGKQLTGAIWKPSVAYSDGFIAEGSATGNNLVNMGRRAVNMQLASGSGDLPSERVRIKIRPTLAQLIGWADSEVFVIPLYATYSMRMHSNPFKKNVEPQKDGSKYAYSTGGPLP